MSCSEGNKTRFCKLSQKPQLHIPLDIIMWTRRRWEQRGSKTKLSSEIFLPASALYSSKMLYWGASTNNIPSETIQNAANSLSGLNKSEVEWRCCLSCLWPAVALLGGWQPVPSCSKHSRCSLPVEMWKCAAGRRPENTFPIMVSVAGL